MTQQPRPKRKRKGDRLLSPGSSQAQIACDFAMAAFDEAGRLAERKWGIDRLPALCSQETAIRYGRALGKLNEAIAATNVDEVARIAAACQRGLAVMDDEATKAGHKPVPLRSASCLLDGQIITVVQEISDLENYQKSENEAVFTAREFAVAIKSLKIDGGLYSAVKDSFPQAELKSIKSKLPKDFWRHGDELPPL